MAKKNFDNFLNTVKSSKISLDEIEEMTKEIHHKTEIAAAPAQREPKKREPKPAAAVAREVRATPPPPPEKKEPAPRGRKPKAPEPERLIRVSVDLPESTMIDLKSRTIRERLPMKDFIRRLVERELYG